MGLDSRLVLSDERHHGPFLCVICRDLTGLADAFVTTSGCSHVACRRCLEAWLGRFRDEPPDGVVDMFGPPPTPRCPACNDDLSLSGAAGGGGDRRHKRLRDGGRGSAATSAETTTMIAGVAVLVRPLAEAQPLAHRILRRVRVRCPLGERHGCPWEGDFGDLHAHLVSESAHLEDGEGAARKIGTAAEEEDGDDDEDGGAGGTKASAVGDDGGDRGTEAESGASDAKASARRRKALAASFKEEANDKFASGDFRDAADLYGKALSVLLPDEDARGDGRDFGVDCGDEHRSLAAALRCNRAAARLNLRDFEGCLSDCDGALVLDPSYGKAHVRKARALIELGRFEEARAGLEDGLEKLKEQDRVSHSGAAAAAKKAVSAELAKVTRVCDLAAQGGEHLREGRYADAKASFGALLRETSAVPAMLGAARAELGLGRADAALRLSLRVLRATGGRSAEGLEVRGAALYLSAEWSPAALSLREALRLDPDGAGAKAALRRCRSVERRVTEARAAAFRRDFGGAVRSYGEALEASDPLPRQAPLYGLLYAERGEAHLRLKQYKDAMKDASLAIYARDDDEKAWMVKVGAFHGLGRHEEAREELEDLMRKWGANNDRIRRAFDKADFEVRKMQRPNFYALFGVPSIASQMEIKKQYKAKALELHPDRFSASKFTDEDRKRGRKEIQASWRGTRDSL